MSKCCENNKVYASYTFTSDPPQNPWVCVICGNKGTDTIRWANRPPSYDDVCKKFEEQKEGE